MHPAAVLAWIVGLAAQALAVASAGARLEFVTVDEAQSRLLETESRSRRLGVRVIRLPA